MHHIHTTEPASTKEQMNPNKSPKPNLPDPPVLPSPGCLASPDPTCLHVEASSPSSLTFLPSDNPKDHSAKCWFPHIPPQLTGMPP